MSMKGNTLLLYVLAICTGLLSACREDMTENMKSNHAVTIKLNSTVMARGGQLRAAGIPELNENKIDKVDVFFFTSPTNASEYHEQDVSVVEGQFQVTLPDGMEGNDYYIGIIANSDKQLTAVDGKTWAELQQMTVTTVFQNEAEKESKFVMQGLSAQAWRMESGTVVGPIQLKRVATKISLYPVIPLETQTNGITINGVTYIPNLEKAHVRMHNVVKKGSIDGTSYTPETEDFMIIIRNYSKGGDMTGKDMEYSHLPFYSYPNDWSEKGEKESYLELCIPWSYEQNNMQRSADYYYHVPIGKDKKLKSNAFYNIKVNISILGSIDPDQATQVEGEFMIQDWTTQLIDADMNRYEYLMLETNYVELNNETETNIGFTTSSVAKAEIISVEYPDYSTQNNNTKSLSKEEIARNYKIEIYGQTLHFSHTIGEDEFTPRTITVEVTNIDHKKDLLTIVQQPDIYIVADYNANGKTNRFVFGYNEESRKDIEDDSGMNINNILDISDPDYKNDKNMNQYTIYITTFNAGDKYIIGDPRTIEVDAMMNGNKKHFNDLKFYYSTQKENVSQMIAPAFKIASSWGGLHGQIKYENAKARCAAYQENGYPAGRWRMPTEAEVEYILTLSNNKRIPELFLTGSDYWASSGRFISGNTWEEPSWPNNNAYIRCVYDVWYWGNEKITDPDKFTWGDEQRN